MCEIARPQAVSVEGGFEYDGRLIMPLDDESIRRHRIGFSSPDWGWLAKAGPAGAVSRGP